MVRADKVAARPQRPSCPRRRCQMIARTWRGATRAEDALEYAEYIRTTGIAEYAATPGNRGAYLLYRIDGDRAEILTLSFWESLGSIRGFAGDDIDQAVFYPEDDRYLIERDLTARHYVVGATAPDPGAQTAS
jgi:heme-degrading monooxygenase HmoA